MGYDPYWELFNRYGLGGLATRFWEAARAGNKELAQQILNRIEQKLAEKGALRAAAGTLARMRNMVNGLLEAAEVLPEAAADAVTLSEELTAEEMLAGATAAEAEALPEELASGPPGWAVAAIVIIVLLIATAAMAHADEKPKKADTPPPPKRPPNNPFDSLPPNLRNDPHTNPAKKINQQAHKKMEEYKKQKPKHCKCYGRVSLGGNPAGRQLAMGSLAPAPVGQCTWPNCPSGRGRQA